MLVCDWWLQSCSPSKADGSQAESRTIAPVPRPNYGLRKVLAPLLSRETNPTSS